MNKMTMVIVLWAVFLGLLSQTDTMARSFPEPPPSPTIGEVCRRAAMSECSAAGANVQPRMTKQVRIWFRSGFRIACLTPTADACIAGRDPNATF